MTDLARLRQLPRTYSGRAIAAYRADLIEKVRALPALAVPRPATAAERVEGWISVVAGYVDRAAVLALLEAEPLDPEGQR